uniref:Uncharacterized protein n=1 Tax=Solanum tuberosum TaxID=4113 RepID=M1A540_SOLTU
MARADLSCRISFTTTAHIYKLCLHVSIEANHNNHPRVRSISGWEFLSSGLEIGGQMPVAEFEVGS